MLYSGHTHEGAPHTEGVGFMLSKQAEKALVSWGPIRSKTNYSPGCPIDR